LGAKKCRLLFKQYPKELIPSVVYSSQTFFLEMGLVKPQKRSRRSKPVFPNFRSKRRCNGVWSADIQGQVFTPLRAGKQKYTVTPLTIAEFQEQVFWFTAKGIQRELSVPQEGVLKQRFLESTVSR